MFIDLGTLVQAYGFGHFIFWIHVVFMVFFYMWLQSDKTLATIESKVRGKTQIEENANLNFILMFFFFLVMFGITNNENDVIVAEKLAVVMAVLEALFIVKFNIERWFTFLFYAVGFSIFFLNEAVLAAKVISFFK